MMTLERLQDVSCEGSLIWVVVCMHSVSLVAANDTVRHWWINSCRISWCVAAEMIGDDHHHIGCDEFMCNTISNLYQQISYVQ